MKLPEAAAGPLPDIALPALFGRKERQSDQIVDPDRVLLGERRVRGKNQAPRVSLRKLNGLVFSPVGSVADDGEVQKSLVKLLRDLLGVSARDMVPKAGILFL